MAFLTKADQRNIFYAWRDYIFLTLREQELLGRNRRLSIRCPAILDHIGTQTSLRYSIELTFEVLNDGTFIALDHDGLEALDVLRVFGLVEVADNLLKPPLDDGGVVKQYCLALGLQVQAALSELQTRLGDGVEGGGSQNFWGGKSGLHLAVYFFWRLGRRLHSHQCFALLVGKRS